MPESLRPLIIATFLLLSCCAGWYFGLYRPKKAKLATVEQDAQDVVLKLQSFTVTDKQLAALELQIERLREEIVQTHSRLIPKSQLSKVVSRLQGQGRRLGLKFDIILPDFDSLMDDPKDQNPADDILKLKLHMKIQGRFKNFGKFADSFARLPFYITIDELLLVYNEKIHPEIEIMLDAIVYLRKTAEAGGKT